jgi:hypothetical protein
MENLINPISYGQWGMTNQSIKILIEQIKGGSTLTKAEQLHVLSALLRANRLLIMARKLGYDPRTMLTEGSSELSGTPEEASPA